MATASTRHRGRPVISPQGDVIWAPAPDRLTTLIHPRLHLSGSFADHDRRRRYDTDVVMCRPWEAADHAQPRATTRLAVPLPDGRLTRRTYRDVKDLAEEVTGRWHDGQRIVIRCWLGLNRSALVAAHVLVNLTGMTGPEATEHLRTLRDRNVLCNPSFDRAVAGL